MAKKPVKQRKKYTFDWKNERVRAIFAFLDRNAKWNKEFQEREYARCLAGRISEHDRLIHFLHLNVNTQSSADMDDLKPFWKAVHLSTPKETSTLKAFTSYMVKQAPASVKKNKTMRASVAVADEWEALFGALIAHPGWGTKTTALFVKAAINLHRGPKSLHFWSDATPERAPVQTKPFLPVDRVILHIFHVLGHPCPSIDNINNGLRREYSAEQMLTWDDLWFWGFFTQTGGGNERTLGWNSGKFWSQLSSSKADEVKLSELGNEFVQLLTSIDEVQQCM